MLVKIKPKPSILVFLRRGKSRFFYAKIFDMAQILRIVYFKILVENGRRKFMHLDVFLNVFV